MLAIWVSQLTSETALLALVTPASSRRPRHSLHLQGGKRTPQ